jgi:hypothetical protein
MTYYTRVQILEILHVEEGFLIALEEEAIISRDAPEIDEAQFSDQMLERARVAANLMHQLDVNLPGVAIILRMREEMSNQRRRIDSFVLELGRRKE